MKENGGEHSEHEMHEGTVYETDKQYGVNDRLVQTLYDNNHEVINGGNRFAFFPVALGN